MLAATAVAADTAGSAVEFASPATVDGDQTIGASWVILEFVTEQASVRLQDAGAVSIVYDNVSRLIHRDQFGKIEGPPVHSEGHRRGELSQFSASWRQVGLLGVRAESITIRADGSTNYWLLEPHSLAAVDSGKGLDNADSEWVADAPQPTIFGEMVLVDSFQIEIANASAIELLGADVQCGAEFCPTGGEVGQAQVASLSAITYSFERMEGVLGSGTVQGNALRMRFGGPQLDVAANGIVRLPRAVLEVPCDCNLDGDATLSLDGEVIVNNMAPQGAGLTGKLSGNAVTFADETPVFLPGIAVTAAGVAAGTIAVVVAAKLLFALFTRLSKQEALEHPKRKAILQYIQEHPGANFREVSRQTSIASGTVRHHLTVLERAGHVVEHQHQGTVRLFENHGKFDHNWSDVVLLREPPLAELHAWLKEHPGSPQKLVLEAFESKGWSRSTTQHRLVRLVHGGVFTIRLQGRLKMYSVADKAPKPLGMASAPAGVVSS